MPGTLGRPDTGQPLGATPDAGQDQPGDDGQGIEVQGRQPFPAKSSARRTRVDTAAPVAPFGARALSLVR